MWRVRAKLTDPSSNQRVLAANEKKHVTWYATLDGALGKFRRKQIVSLTEHCNVATLDGALAKFDKNHLFPKKNEACNKTLIVASG
jgi:hypothetical protein